VLAAAMIECGFVDRREKGLYIHDLEDHEPDYVKSRRRMEKSRSLRNNKPDSNGDVTQQMRNCCAPPAPAPAPIKETPITPTEGGAPPGSRKRPPGELFTKEFVRFWESYPRKVGKAAAWRAWRSLNGTRPPIEAILDALKAHRSTEQWQRDGGQFIPHPATWLRHGRWDDEPEKNNASHAPKPIPKLTEEERESLKGWV
jgi:hypothetical protein